MDKHDSITPVPDQIEAESLMADDVVTISRGELESLRARASGSVPAEGVGRHSGDSKPSTSLERIKDEEASARDKRLTELEVVCKSAVRERELATVLAGRALVGGAAAQLIKLWSEEFDVYEEQGRFKVTSRDGRAVSQVVNEWLASPEYSHFCLPTSRGGTGAKDASRPVGGSGAKGAPKTLGEAIVMKWREEAAAQPNNLLKPIGLRRDR